jgi:ABC-type nickel/cobalt efflux system permease component RcnA
MPPEPPNIPAQLSSRFQAVAVIVTVVALAWGFFMFFLPAGVVKAVHWFFDALSSVVLLYFIAYWWRWRAIPPFLSRAIQVFPRPHRLDKQD